MTQIGTKIKEDKAFLKRADYQKELLKKLKAETDKVKLGGGKKSIERQKAKGKLTARERIDLLLDDKNEFYELSTFAIGAPIRDHTGQVVAAVSVAIPQGRYNQELKQEKLKLVLSVALRLSEKLGYRGESNLKTMK